MVFENIKHGAKAVTPSEDHTMPRWFSRPKFHKWKGKVQMNAQFSSCGQGKLLVTNRPARNSTMFSSRESVKCPV